MAQARRKTSKRSRKQSGPKRTSSPRTPELARDDPRQAIESGEPRLTGYHEDRGVSDSGPGKARRTTKTTGKDSPEQAWESGRPEAMP